MEHFLKCFTFWHLILFNSYATFLFTMATGRLFSLPNALVNGQVNQRSLLPTWVSWSLHSSLQFSKALFPSQLAALFTFSIFECHADWVTIRNFMPSSLLHVPIGTWIFCGSVVAFWLLVIFSLGKFFPELWLGVDHCRMLDFGLFIYRRFWISTHFWSLLQHLKISRAGHLSSEWGFLPWLCVIWFYWVFTAYYNHDCPET